MEVKNTITACNIFGFPLKLGQMCTLKMVFTFAFMAANDSCETYLLRETQSPEKSERQQADRLHLSLQVKMGWIGMALSSRVVTFGSLYLL